MQNVIVKTPTIILLFYNSHIAEMSLKLPEVINQTIFVLWKKNFKILLPPYSSIAFFLKNKISSTEIFIFGKSEPK